MASRCSSRSVPTRSLKFIPVVVLTSSHEEKDMVASYNPGVNAYVVKPVDFPRLHGCREGVGVLLGSIVNEPPPGSVGQG